MKVVKSQFTNIELIVCEDSKELSLISSQKIIDFIKAKPKAVLGLATGSTPIETYANIVNDHKTNNTDWSKIKTFNLDEYANFDVSKPQSYFSFMHIHLFDHINIKSKNVHIPKGNGSLKKLNKISMKYEKSIRKAGGIDFQLLGLGSNGHIAFNEPGTSFESRTHYQELKESTRKDNSKDFNNDINAVPTASISMGLASIMDSKEILLLAFGEAKQKAIKSLFYDNASIDSPVTILQKHPKVTIIIDELASKDLKIRKENTEYHLDK